MQPVHDESLFEQYIKEAKKIMGVMIEKLARRNKKFAKIAPYVSMMLDIFWYLLVIYLILNVRELTLNECNAHLETMVCFPKNSTNEFNYSNFMDFNYSDFMDN